jgi:hypothetical protein
MADYTACAPNESATRRERCHLRDRTSFPVSTASIVRPESGADAPRVRTFRVRRFGRRAVERRPQGVTYVPGLICHPCSRPHA